MGNKSTKLVEPQNQQQSLASFKSHIEEVIFKRNNNCNNDCPVCKKSGKTPNLAGRFFLINDRECQCNACNTIFPKEEFYKPVINDVQPL